MLKPNFQEQVDIDLNAVFFNESAKEFVTVHTIGRIEDEEPVSIDIVVDHELYTERKLKDGIENVSLDGVIIFIKKDHWENYFGNIPKINSVWLLDNDEYTVEAAIDDMGIYEITLSGARG